MSGVEVDVDYQSGSHYAAIQAPETLDKPSIRLNFAGSSDERLARLVAGTSKAATLFGAHLYIAEKLGLRKIADTTFIIIGVVPDGADPAKVAKYYAATRRASEI